MTPENTLSILKSYLKKDNTQYALQLDGGWGTGKTFFWKKSIVPLIADNGKTPVYISLNGLNSIQTLQRSLLFSFMPKTIDDAKKNTWLKTAMTVSGNIAKSASKALLKVDPMDLLQGVGLENLDFSDKFVCFDDLERCRIPIKELLGFINSFVEHKQLKCLIIADENKIFETETDQKTSYYSIKEKVIGRVINYKPELANTLPQLFNRYSGNPAYHEFLKQNENYIKTLFEEQKESNIRIILFFLDSLEELIKNTMDIEPEIQKELLFLTATISIEFKRGQLKASEANDYKGLNNANYFWYQNLDTKNQSLKIFGKKKEPEQPKTYAEEFYLKYISSHIHTFHFYKSVYTYVLSGYLNKEQLQEEIESRRPKQQSPEEEAFTELIDYNFRKLNDEEFAKYLTDVLDFAEKGIYDMYSYERISSFYHFFAEKGMVTYTDEEIDSKLLAGLDIAAKRKEIDRRLYDNLTHFDLNDPKVKPLRAKIIELHSAIDKEEIKAESNVLLEVLQKEDYEELSALFKNKKFHKDFIAYVDGAKLFTVIEGVSNKYLSLFTNEIRERYKHTNVAMFYPNDYECIATLNTVVKKKIKDKELPVLRKFLLSELKVVLSKTCEAFENNPE